ncbi:hypothetical protein AB3S75_024971 [Citrus x aurantiifolia]
MTSKQETFTVWMKSLVCHSNGCTVFNSNGEIIYRVENYDNKCNKEVYLMDLRGKVLFTIRRRKCALAFGRWDGYRWSSTGSLNKEKPWFQVKIYYCRFLMGNLACQVTVARDRYWILKKSARKPAFRIVMTLQQNRLFMAWEICCQWDMTAKTCMPLIHEPWKTMGFNGQHSTLLTML